MTGTALAQHARRRRADLPIVIATGVPSAVTHDEGFAILPKPYTRHTLGVAVGSIFQPVA